MKIELIERAGLVPALFGIGLSYGLTSGKSVDDIHPFAEPVDKNLHDRLVKIASKLCTKSGGEDKFLRQIIYWWDVTAPRYWWIEADTYKVGTTAQSESTMHRITARPLSALADFEEPVDSDTVNKLNNHIKWYKETDCDIEEFMAIKNSLPEGFLQRRIWTLNLANMKNIYNQRRNHKLPQWKEVCKAFIEATPDFLRGMYNG